jgi:hypothetical protein
MPTWYKWDYVCSNCDAHVEITALVDGHSIKNEMCMKCLSPLTLVSVVDVTIPTIQPAQTKEDKMDMPITNPDQLISVEVDGGRFTKSLSEVANDIVKYNNLVKQLHEYNNKIQLVNNIINSSFEDSDDPDTLTEIAKALGIPLTKEISVTAYVQVQMTVEVDMADGDYDIENMIYSNLTIDSFGSEIVVNDYTVDRVEEN